MAEISISLHTAGSSIVPLTKHPSPVRALASSPDVEETAAADILVVARVDALALAGEAPAVRTAIRLSLFSLFVDSVEEETTRLRGR